MKNFLKLSFARTAHTTNGEVAAMATIVGMFKMVVIKVKIINIMIVMILSMIFNRIGFFLFDFFIVLFPSFILQPLDFYDYIFCIFYALFLASSGAWSYRWLISSNTYEAYRLVLRLSYRLLKDDRYSKVESKLEKMRWTLQRHLRAKK